MEVASRTGAILARLDAVYPEVLAIAVAAHDLLLVFDDTASADGLGSAMTAEGSDARHEDLRETLGIGDLVDAVQATAGQLCAVVGVPVDIPPRPGPG